MRRTVLPPLLALLVAVFFLAPPSLAQSEVRPRANADASRVPAKLDRQSRDARRATLRAVKSWGYQLRLIDPAGIAASPFDLVVVDHALSADRRFLRELTPGEVATMKARPDGSRRLVLAYLSIGEAERYRFYWQQQWYEPGRAPSWLATANDRWDGNWRARFWEPGWQELIFTGADTYLARIKAQGFDGIYLDRADVYSELWPERPSARADMVRFIRELAAAARRDNPALLVVMQNAEELLRDEPLRAALDGVAKEDLYFGVEHDERPNPAAMVAGSLADLRRARKSGLAVMTVEYLGDPRLAQDAAHRSAREGFVHLNAERSLGSLPSPPP